MKKHLIALLALVALLVGCPSNAPTPQVDASAFEAGTAVDASIDGASHRVGSFNPTCTATGVPRVVSGVQQGACSLGTANQVLTTNAGGTDITWTTPTAGSTPTGTGIPHIVAGVQQAAASLVSQTADVTGVLPLANGGTNASAGLTTANGVVTSSGTALQQASGVLAGTNFVSIGATVPANGAVRMASLTGVYGTAGGDILLLNNTGTGNIQIGQTTAPQGDLNMFVPAGQAMNLQVGANYGLRINASNAFFTSPIVGDPAQNSPYSVHGKVTDATAGAFTVTAATYKFDVIQLTGGTAATVTFPLPATDAAAYYKTLINTSGVTKTIAAGAAATVQPFNTGNTARFMFDSGGVHLAAASTAYP